MYELNLSRWEVEVTVPNPTEENPHGMKLAKQEYPYCQNLSGWLRAPGVFRSGEEIAEAVVLAKTIRDAKDDIVKLDEREAEILKKALNRHIEASAEGKTRVLLGGEIHEEAIVRVFTMKEVK